jgi:excisionase family DNA binding protein
MRKLSTKLSVEEVAEELGISRFTVRRWVAEKKIAFFKVGGRIVFDKKDIHTLLLRSRVEPAGEPRA